MLLGKALKDEIVKKVKNENSCGLLVDEAVDISVVEQLILFIQFSDPDTGAPKVHFLSIQNVLENSTSANAKTIVKLIKEELSKNDFDINKLSSLASDGASVMIGYRIGVAAKLREVVPKLTDIHNICHHLALACNDANDNLTSISQAETVFWQLWSFFENSTARLAVYVQISSEMKELSSVSEESKEKLARRGQKACTCRTRWLSLDKSVERVCRNGIHLFRLHLVSTYQSSPTLSSFRLPKIIQV